MIVLFFLYLYKYKRFKNIMKTKHLITFILIWLLVGWCTIQGYAQQQENTPYVRYSFKIEGITEYVEAKPIWNDIRYFFNYESDPFRYRLDLSRGLFTITLPRLISNEEIINHFDSKDLNITELNIYYYE
jgi:hypothetical protein